MLTTSEQYIKSGWDRTPKNPIPRPPFRRLRGYAFDPSLSTQLETALVNQAVFKVIWEDDLAPGPIGEYLEVVDFDPPSNCFYTPVDLNNPYILAQDGLSPSEGNPQFHQQMVYAVAMTTIRNFERALGRWALWSERTERFGSNGSEAASSGEDDPYVGRLRIYPHALREANAYYSPKKKALLFGYFPAADTSSGSHFPGGTVFTCLSHDIIAHETTHALLDGMHRRFIEPTHADTLAFHEAFADIVALFQHFSFPEVLKHQIARTRGDLASQSLLGELAQQFGKAIGNYGALRDAIGQVNPETKKWEPRNPDPDELQRTFEPHDRGAILVAAVFDAFISIYKKKVTDLFRIATSGTGVLPAGEIHPDLVNRLAAEASKTAQHVLTICIRALDYCPPVDICFGDYLRAIITADSDMVPDDDLGYRIAIIEAFRRRGIYPRDVRTLSVDSLRWPGASELSSVEWFRKISDRLLGFFQSAQFFEDRRTVYTETKRIQAELHVWLQENLGDDEVGYFEELTGLAMRIDPSAQVDGLRPSRRRVDQYNFEIHSVRTAQRVGPDGDALNQMIISITQKRMIRIDPENDDAEKFTFRGGCTLILDLDTMNLRYAIKKDIRSPRRLEQQIRFMEDGRGGSLRATYFGDVNPDQSAEPFALLHRKI